MNILRTAFYRITLFAFAVLCCSLTLPGGEPDAVINSTINPSSLYTSLNLQAKGLNPVAYNLAVKGWQRLKASGKATRDIVSICDFTQSSTLKRFYVIDMSTGTLLFNTWVAHGKNTGDEFAKYFSNQPSSLKSSLGFYVAKGSYTGEHGTALKLWGVEPGINNNAEDRAIVMHGASYVSAEFIKQWGKLGRSFGCPALSNDVCGKVINTIKEGSCLFVYYPDKNYLATSKLLK